jgi:Zn-dependent M32 family carboxypeptidase
MRGQLVQEPGYMANYAVGAVLAADLRAAIRAARGDWIDGDPGWYAWVTERVYRYGQERSAGDVLRDVLGRPPNEAAVLADIGRARGTG